MITISLYIAVFIFTVAIIQVFYLAWAESRFIEKRKVKKRLMYISAGGKHGQEKLAKYRKGVLKDIGAYERFIFNIPRFSNLDKLLIKTNIPINATLFILLSLTLGMIGFGLGYLYLPQKLAAIATQHDGTTVISVLSNRLADLNPFAGLALPETVANDENDLRSSASHP